MNFSFVSQLQFTIQKDKEYYSHEKNVKKKTDWKRIYKENIFFVFDLFL